MAPDSTHSWEAFLDTVEADMHRTERLLMLVMSDSGTFPVGAEDLVASVTNPAPLPDPSQMPQIPADLLHRVTILRGRISMLRKELEIALNEEHAKLATVTELKRPNRAHRTFDPVPVTPLFVDTAL